jgi:hypothetical protein
MLKRMVWTLAASLSFGGAAAAQNDFAIGSAVITAPVGWSDAKKEKDRVVLRSPDGRQQATISIMRFDADVSFDDFKRLCAHRIEAEKGALADGFVQPGAPFEDAGTFGMFFSGGEKRTARVFSGYLTLKQRELITVYVEGIGVAPKDHLASFEALASGLKR